MANEFDVKDAEGIAKKLDAEIKSSSEDTKEKEDLLGLINILINMPNLLKENAAIESAVERNRAKLSYIEGRVSIQEADATQIIDNINKDILKAEDRLSERITGHKQAEKDADTAHADNLHTKQVAADLRIKIIDDSLKSKEAKLSSVTSELDAAEGKLRKFKQSVSEM